MYLKFVFMVISAFGFGLLSSGGVFTVFVSVGLVPRFADKTYTAAYIMKYENAIVAGTILGCLFSIYSKGLSPVFGKFGELPLPGAGAFTKELPFLGSITWGSLILAVFGIFAGMFVGWFGFAFKEQAVAPGKRKTLSRGVKETSSYHSSIERRSGRG